MNFPLVPSFLSLQFCVQNLSLYFGLGEKQTSLFFFLKFKAHVTSLSSAFMLGIPDDSFFCKSLINFNPL